MTCPPPSLIWIRTHSYTVDITGNWSGLSKKIRVAVFKSVHNPSLNIWTDSGLVLQHWRRFGCSCVKIIPLQFECTWCTKIFTWSMKSNVRWEGKDKYIAEQIYLIISTILNTHFKGPKQTECLLWWYKKIIICGNHLSKNNPPNTNSVVSPLRAKEPGNPSIQACVCIHGYLNDQTGKQKCRFIISGMRFISE